MTFGYLQENLACSKEYKRRPRPTQGCRANDDYDYDDDDDDDEKIYHVNEEPKEGPIKLPSLTC